MDSAIKKVILDANVVNVVAFFRYRVFYGKKIMIHRYVINVPLMLLYFSAYTESGLAGQEGWMRSTYDRSANAKVLCSHFLERNTCNTCTQCLK